jgi:MazG family protein
MTDDEMISCKTPGRQIDRLRSIMQRLRAPGGCPWDAEQTHQSIIGEMLEESYEVVDAIQHEDWTHLREELGDVLLQVVFHAQIASEAGRYTLDEIACDLNDKLVRRHPHVFGTSQVRDTDGVLTQWDQIKREERKAQKEHYLDHVGHGLPALLKANKLQKKAARVGFDWPSPLDVVEKIREETQECTDELNTPTTELHLQEEIGDLMFAVVNLCRKCHIDPEVALASANHKFESRFNAMEDLLASQNTPLGEADLNTMEACWQQAKLQEKEGN